jgi:hypothetical protein
MFTFFYHTDEEYFLLKYFENNHKCVPFGLFITKINLLLLLIFFLSLAVFKIYFEYKAHIFSEIPTLLDKK